MEAGQEVEKIVAEYVDREITASFSAEGLLAIRMEITKFVEGAPLMEVASDAAEIAGTQFLQSVMLAMAELKEQGDEVEVTFELRYAELLNNGSCDTTAFEFSEFEIVALPSAGARLQLMMEKALERFAIIANKLGMK